MDYKSRAKFFDGQGDHADATEELSFEKFGTQWPGSIENMHNKSRDVFPVPFTGAKLVINKGLSPNFQVSHSVFLDKPEQAGYRFGVTYVGHNKISDTDPFPVLMGELQPNGNLQAQIIHYLHRTMRLRYMTQIQNSRLAGQQLAADFKHNRWQIGVTVINPDLEKRQCMTAIDVMRQITPRFSLGSMFFAQFAPQIPSGRDGVWSIGMRYTHSPMWSCALSMRPWHRSFHTSFHMRVNESLQMAAELESNYQQQTNVATIGYQYDIPKTMVMFKTQLDSNLNVATTLEKKLLPFPFSLTLSTTGSLIKSHYDIGIGLVVG